MTTNKQRADRATDAVLGYVTAKGETFESSTDEITDLMADLLHLAARYAEDDGGNVEDYVEKVIRLSQMHFDAEHGNQEEEAA